jgi:catechol 2,3-dioxygenase-like lactoylglutathione lyase family enzyme
MANLGYISPFFIVANVETSVAFYVGRLGFEVRYIAPADGPFFAIVGRDEISIFLKAIAPDVLPVPNYTRHPWARWDAFVYVSDPDALFFEFRDRGVVFHRELEDDGDGLRGFEIADGDGYILFLGRPVAS